MLTTEAIPTPAFTAVATLHGDMGPEPTQDAPDEDPPLLDHPDHTQEPDA